MHCTEYHSSDVVQLTVAVVCDCRQEQDDRYVASFKTNHCPGMCH